MKHGVMRRGDGRRVRGAWNAAILVSLACGACHTDDSARQTWESLVDTERQFATAAESYGMKVAFLRFLDDDSILFRPHPVNGKRFMMGRPDSGVRLTWEPTRAGVSRSGDLGWTTGPYRLEPDAPDNVPLLGYFVSVWKRQSTGRWKVVVDLGTVNPAEDPCAEETELAPPSLEATSTDAEGAGAEAELMALEWDLGRRAANDGSAAALADVFATDVRVYRDGACPASGQTAALALLDARAGVMSWKPTAATVSDAADLAYTHGSYEIRDGLVEAALVETGYYVRAWSRTADGAWQLLLDITSPVPPGQGESAGSTAD
jgi:ketosteroid isomerase-like protein